MTEGRKDDGEKIRLELIPPELLFGVGSILTFGAKKYTWEYETEWDRLLDVKNVKGIKFTTAGECVVLVTKNNLGQIILNSQKDNDKTVGIGKNEILTKLSGLPNVGKIVQKLVNETKEQNGWEDLLGLGYLKNSTSPYVEKDVKFADRQSTLTLTIATKQGDLEEYYVQDVITDSDFWETMWKDLNELYDISRPVDTTGDRNWELGMNWSRVFGALMRHMWAWWGGEKVDPETGKSHLWHAGCCIAFLIAYEERKVGNDDRPKENV